MYTVIQVFENGTTEEHRNLEAYYFSNVFLLELWIADNQLFAHEYCIALIVEE